MWFPLWSIQFYKITSIFGQNLTIRTAHDTFLESRHPDVTKNVCYGCPQARAKCPFFLVSSSWIICFNYDFVIAFCDVLIE